MLHGEPNSMAAQKLTRGRFAQIIIMLTMLITAFIWRTVEHDEAISISCNNGEKCTFYVNNSRFEVVISDPNILIKTNNNDWELRSENGNLNTPHHQNGWSLKLRPESDQITFKLTQKDESIEQLVSVKSI